MLCIPKDMGSLGWPLVVRYVSLLSWSLYLFHVLLVLMNTIQPKKKKRDYGWLVATSFQLHNYFIIIWNVTNLKN